MTMTRLLLTLLAAKLVSVHAFAVWANRPTKLSLSVSQARHTSRIPKLNSISFGDGWDIEEDDDDEDDDDENTFDQADELSDDELLSMAEPWDERIAPFNTIHLSGRVGYKNQPKYFEDGKVVLSLSLAVKRKYHNMERAVKQIGSGEEETDWFKLEVWGQTAEFVSKYVDRGARVGVVGTLEVDQWNDRDTGDLRSKPKVIVRDFDLLETKAEAEARRQRSSGGGGGEFYGNAGDSAGTGGFFDM